MTPEPVWSNDSDGAIAEAIRIFELRKIGWRGFEDFQWVRDLKEQYPQIEDIATNCSSISGAKLAEVDALFKNAASTDHSAIRAYFIGKLALEKLSCLGNGSGAGMCDKFSAYLQIYQRTKVFAT